jgi:hypothetical protein
VKNRRGPKKAIVAVAASMLTAVYFMLRDGVEYHDLGGRYFVDHDKQQLTKSLLRRSRDLGVEVEPTPSFSLAHPHQIGRTLCRTRRGWISCCCRGFRSARLVLPL